MPKATTVSAAPPPVFSVSCQVSVEGVTSAPFRGQHRGDAGQTLRCLWLHGPGRIQQRDPGQGHRQGWPGGGSQDHPKQRAHVSLSRQRSNKHMDVGFINNPLAGRRRV